MSNQPLSERSTAREPAAGPGHGDLVPGGHRDALAANGYDEHLGLRGDATGDIHDSHIAAPALFSAIAARAQEAARLASEAGGVEWQVPRDGLNQSGVLDPQLGGGRAAGPVGTGDGSPAPAAHTTTVRLPSETVVTAIKRTASKAFGNSSDDASGSQADLPGPSFIRAGSSNAKQYLDADADPATRYWVETAAGWITTAAHPYAAAGLPVEEAWSAQARKAIEAVPIGYMRFFKLIDRKQRLSNPRAKTPKAAAGAATVPPTDSPSVITERQAGKMEWREMYRCKACGAEQDSQAGHTENVQKHIRLRKCKRLEDPPFRSGLLQDDDSLVKAVLNQPHGTIGDDRTQAAKLSARVVGEPLAAASTSQASTVPSAQSATKTLSAVRDFLLQTRRPFTYAETEDFASFTAGLTGSPGVGSFSAAEIWESFVSAERKMDVLHANGLDIVKQRRFAVFASLAVVPLRAPNSTVLEPCTHVQALLWLHFAAGLKSVGWMPAGCATIPLDPSAQGVHTADAKLAALLRQALSGLELPGTASIPVSVSNPILARLLDTSARSLGDVKCDYVIEPSKAIAQAAELLLAHIGLEFLSPTRFLTLKSGVYSTKQTTTANSPQTNVRIAVDSETKRARSLRALAGKALMPASIRKALATVLTGSGAIAAATPEQRAVMDAHTVATLVDLAGPEPDQFTWKDWAKALMVVCDLLKPDARRPGILGSLPALNAQELTELQAVASSLRSMVGAVNMMENPAGSICNDLPVIWSTSMSMKANADRSNGVAQALRLSADQLHQYAQLFADSKMHLLAALLHPSHRLTRIAKLSTDVAVRALKLLAEEFGSKEAPAAGEGTQQDESVNYDDIFPDLMPADSQPTVLSNTAIKAALKRLDAASQTWLTSNATPSPPSIQDYWSDLSLPEVLRRAADRYVWMTPNSARKLVDEACAEVTAFGRNMVGDQQSGDRSGGGGVASEAVDEQVLQLAMYQLRRSSRKIDIILDPFHQEAGPGAASN
ncbi:hypothetical protein V8E36_000653 [Tilletia maclaganii]